MNDFDLAAKLRSAPLPVRPDDYWDDFPVRVRVRLHRRPPALPRRAWRTPLVWAGDFALTLALVFLCLEFHPAQAASTVITRDEKHLQAKLSRLDAGLHRLMLNTDGMSYLLGEAN